MQSIEEVIYALCSYSIFFVAEVSFLLRSYNNVVKLYQILGAYIMEVRRIEKLNQKEEMNFLSDE